MERREDSPVDTGQLANSDQPANSAQSDPDAPFAGVRVIELAQWVFVPVSGALMADWGADVIRVDQPEGDPYRNLATQGIGTDSGGINLSVALANRGKRSIALNLKTPDGMAMLHRLLETADILLTSLRPDALARLGLGAEELTQRYPRLIYARGNGYGMRGPDSGRAGYDSSAFFARGGVAHVLTPPDRDYPIGQRGAMGDRNGGMALAFGMSAALLRRERTGKGSVVDVSLLATAMWNFSSDVLSALAGGKPRASNDRTGGPNPLVGTYRTKDGRHIQLVFLQPDRYWPEFCVLIGRDDLLADERFTDMKTRGENREAFLAAMDAEFASRTYEEWTKLLSELDAPWAPVQTIEELLTDPQVIANNYIGPVNDADGNELYKLPAVPVQFDQVGPPLRQAPAHSQNTEEILHELGYDDDQIRAYREAGAVS
jgi:crotonobetainyl-CoA:carnitine CoA-transferase CaiB-like acyl-CoA transferase